MNGRAYSKIPIVFKISPFVRVKDLTKLDPCVIGLCKISGFCKKSHFDLMGKVYTLSQQFISLSLISLLVRLPKKKINQYYAVHNRLSPLSRV